MFPPSEPAGSALADALNALAAAVDCARRNVRYGPEMTWPLIGQVGLARFLMPARGDHSGASRAPPCRDRAADAHRGHQLPAPRHHDQISATMTTNPPPGVRMSESTRTWRRSSSWIP